MKTIINSLATLLLICLTEAQIQPNVVPNEDNDFISIQKELPDANLYRKTGDWIMRATSDRKFLFTRLQFTLQNDEVIENQYVGKQRVYSGVVSHIKDNKVLQSLSSDGQQRRIVCLYQDDKVLVSLIVNNNTEVLEVLVKCAHTSHIDDISIEKIISQRILNKPNIRALVENLVNRLVFVNQNLYGNNCELGDPLVDIPIADSDLVDCDLTNALGRWKLKASTDEMYFNLIESDFHLNGDRVVISSKYNNGPGMTVTVEYVGNSRIIRGNIYGHQFYQYSYVCMLYVDNDQFIMVGSSRQTPRLIAVFCRVESECNTDYLKGVIDNQLLFITDIKRYIKDLVPKLSWK